MKKLGVLAAAAFLTMAAPAVAQDNFPSRPVTVVVAVSAGGTGDTWMRLIMPYLAERWGVPISIVNRPGGSQVVGTMSVLTSAPDGYTVLFDGTSSPAIAAVQTNAPFRWDEPTPIANLVSTPLAISVAGDSPWKTLGDAMAEIKASPQGVKLGTGGVSAPGVFGIAKLLDSVGVDPTKVQRIVFDGGAPTLAAVAGRHVSLASQPLPEAIPLAQAGRIRLLAVSSDKRLPSLPDVPTAKEAGFPGYDLGVWGAISGPPKMPAAVVAKWADGLKQILQNPELQQKLAERHTVVSYLDPAQHKEFLRQEYTLRLDLAEKLGLRK